jgi:cell wall-associated NlpC family hydrolase
MPKPLAYDVVARDKSTKTFDKIGKSVDRTDKKFGVLSARTKGLTAGMKVGFGAAAGAIGAIGAGNLLKGFITESRESAKVTRITENAIRATGGAAKISAAQVGALAEKLSNKTAIDDEVIQTGANLLLTFKQVRNEVGEGNNVFDRATAAAADLSIQFGSVDGAAKMLGKALNDPLKGMTALGRAGVTFTEQQKKQITTLVETGQVLQAQKVILKEVESQVGGAAAAAADPIQRLGVVWSNLQESIGGAALPALESVATWISVTGIPAVKEFITYVGGIGEAFGDLPQWMQIGVGAIAGIAAIAPLAIGAFNKIKDAAETLYLKFLLMDTAGKLMAVSLGVIGVALTIGAVLLGNHAQRTAEAKARQEEFTQAGKELNDVIREQNGIITEVVVKKAAEIAEDKGLLKGLRELGIGYGTVTDAILNQGGAYEQIRAKLLENIELNERRLKVRGGGTSGEAQREIDRNRALLETLDGVVGAKDRDATANERVKKAANEAAGAIDGQTKSLKDLIAAEQERAGVVLSYREAQRRYQESLDAVNESVKENGRTLDVTSKKGRANQVTLDAVAKAALDQAEAMRANGGSQDLVRRKMSQARAEFIRTAVKMGASREEARKLADKLRLIPGEYEADITADTKKGHQKVDSFMRKDIARVTKRFKAIIDADTSDAASAITRFIKKQQDRGIVLSTEGKFLGFRGTGGVARAQGGPINGPGSATSDSIPAWLSNGEYVINAESTRKHRGLVEAINQDKVPRFAKGGAAAKLPVDVNMSGWLSGVNAMIKKFAESMGGPGIGRALQWAKSQAGKPYVWGGVGPGGYDCSGFMSAITNVIRGRNPYSRLGSTATFPWGGFAPGYGPFTIGSTPNAGGGIGHMAGTLGKVNVESRGGDGVVVGSSARGASSGLFSTRASIRMAKGGLAKGDPPFDQLDPRGMYYGKFDKGGILKPGRTIVDNHTGGNETVFPGGPKEFGEAVAEALYRKMSERGKFLVAVDQARAASLMLAAG